MLVCVIIRSVSENKTSLLMISFVIAEGGRLAFTYFPAYTGVKQVSSVKLWDLSPALGVGEKCLSVSSLKLLF